MPIEVARDVKVLSRAEFHELASRLLRIVFDVHNQFGRFLDEALYKREIAARWETAALGTAAREIQINVSHETYRKRYFLDLLFNEGLLLEAKVAEAIISAHRSQGFNYLFPEASFCPQSFCRAFRGKRVRGLRI